MVGYIQQAFGVQIPTGGAMVYMVAESYVNSDSTDHASMRTSGITDSTTKGARNVNI